jgi:general secretion pathway protein G
MKTRKCVSRKFARGFTLLEMMLVVMIMGVLLGVAAWNIIGTGAKARVAATRASMKMVDGMLKSYNLDYGTYPSSLQALVPKYTEKMPVDAWKHPLVYNPNPPGSPQPFSLYSTGASTDGGNDTTIDFWKEDDGPVGGG